MKRVVLFVVLVSWIATTPAFAAGPDSTSPGAAPAPVAMKYDFSAKAAGIDRMPQTPAPPDPLRVAPQSAQATQTTQTPEKTSFWKTPWPYLIGGAVVIALVVVSQNTEGGLY